MAVEKAIAIPFDTSEIIEIACQEFRKRLQSLSPLQNNKEYMGFVLGFNVTVKLFRMGHNGGGEKDTLAWGEVNGGVATDNIESQEVAGTDDFKSSHDVNQERMNHDLPLTVESSDGKGGKIRKKVKVKDDKK